MKQRLLGSLGLVSELTLGGGGIGQVWGPTTRKESIATAHAAVDAGISVIDVAPSYGNGESERVIGEAFNGAIPKGVKIATKCLLGNPEPEMVETKIRSSLERSLALLKIDKIDLFILHSYIVPNVKALTGNSDPNYQDLATEWSLYINAWCPAMCQLITEGLIDAWAISGIGIPSQILKALAHNPAPAAVQVITNALHSAGALKLYDEPERPKELIFEASRRGIGVFGIRAVQAGALTDNLDRRLDPSHPDNLDFLRAEAFRVLARNLGEKPAVLAHRYALSMEGVGSVILGVKNRYELDDCLAASEAGVLDDEIINQIDLSAGGPGSREVI